MFSSLSQPISSKSFGEIDYQYVHSLSPLPFLEAKKFCESRSGFLLSPTTSQEVSEVKHYLAKHLRSSDFRGVWTSDCGDPTKCKLVDLSGIKQHFNPHEVVFHALCELDRAVNEESSLIYTCQCPFGFGYENCTEALQDGGTVHPGFTYCQSEQTEVEINADLNRYLLSLWENACR